MKRIVSIILSLFVLCAVNTTIAYGAEKGNESVIASSGDHVIYRVYAKADQEHILSGLNLTVNYDSNKLEIYYDETNQKSISMPDLPTGMLNPDNDGSGAIVATYADGINGTDMSKGVVLLEAEFVAIGDVDTSISYNLEEFFDYSGDNVVYLDKNDVYTEVMVGDEIHTSVSDEALLDDEIIADDANTTDNDSFRVGMIVIGGVVIVLAVIVVCCVVLPKCKKTKKINK